MRWMPQYTENVFSSVPADIEANERLREPQKEAHKAVRRHFSKDTSHAIIQIPVGRGKTGIIATLPFGISNGRVLVITPNVTIRDGVAQAVNSSDPNNFWRKAGVLRDYSMGPYRAVLDGPSANIHDCDESHFVVTNIQQLASSADRWLPQFAPDYFDMILVDEGHHNAAPSWSKVFHHFANAKVVSLTATPFRSDGVRPVGNIIYRYPFTRAMLNGYIKQIHSRNLAPDEIYFTYRDQSKHLGLAEVLKLREEVWFRRGVALSPECNEHIVDASMRYLNDMRERTGYNHQIIAVACSIDHARQIRSLYEERGIKSREIFSQMEKEEQEETLSLLRRGRIDCVVQVQMLGEGFDHPPLSVAAIFRPFRSLSPYIQFIGRVMRVIHESKPDHPDNHAYIVSHVGLNNDGLWNDFRELDFDDQRLVKAWLTEQAHDESEDAGEGRPRRFDVGMLVDNEIIGEFIARAFLDPDDDRVLEEILDRDIGGGLRVRDIIPKTGLRDMLRQRQADKSSDHVQTAPQPQERREQARKRLRERTSSVAMRIIRDLGLAPVGWEIGKKIKAAAGRDNRTAAIELMNKSVNKFLKVDSKMRDKLTTDQLDGALAELDRLADKIVAEFRAGTV